MRTAVASYLRLVASLTLLLALPGCEHDDTAGAGVDRDSDELEVTGDAGGEGTRDTEEPDRPGDTESDQVGDAGEPDSPRDTNRPDGPDDDAAPDQARDTAAPDQSADVGVPDLSADSSADSGSDAQPDVPSTDPVDLCTGLLPNDFSNHPRTALDRPAVGETVTDPAFGTTIRRIASEQIPMYSTISAWNADESLLILYEPGGGHRLYDGQTYESLGGLSISPSDIEQVYWHTSDPDVLFYPSGNRLVRYHIADGEAETVRTFEFCGSEASAGGDPFFMSFDSDVIGLKCGNTHFIYRISTDTVTGSQTSGRDLAPQASPSGQHAYWQGDVAALDLSIERSLGLDNPYDHASMGIGTDGTDYYLSVVFDGSDIGSLTAHEMTTGAAEVIIGPDTGYPYPPGGTHVSGLAYRNPGWAVVSIIAEGAGSTLLQNEIVVANFETGNVCRAAHHRSTGDDYWAEPHAVPSPTGTRILFGSDWGNNANLDAYVLELPAYE